MKKISSISLVVFFMVTLSGCVVTPKVWETNEYNEAISATLVNESALIAKGNGYSYVFKKTEELKKLLALRDNIELSVDLSNVNHYNSDQMTVDVALVADSAALSEQDAAELISLGFTANQGADYEYKFKIKGYRTFLENTSDFNILDQKYRLTITEKSGAVDNLSKIVVTPIAVAVDTTVGVIGIAALGVAATVGGVVFYILD